MKKHLISSFILLLAFSCFASAQEPISPITVPQGLNSGKVELGKKLFLIPDSPNPVGYPVILAITLC